MSNFRNMKRNVGFFLAALPLLHFGGLLLVGCRKTRQSSVKSLENFAMQSNVRFNECSAPDGQDTYMAQPLSSSVLPLGTAANLLDEPLIYQTQLALTSVPKEFQRAFKDLGGQIVLTEKSGEICTASAKKFDFNSKDLALVSGCVIFSPKDETHGQVLTMYLPSDRKSIGHGVTFMMGSFISQIVPKLSLAKKEKIDSIKTEIAIAYINDLTSVSSKVFGLKSLENHMGSADFLALKGRKITDKSHLTNMTFDTDDKNARRQRLDQLLSMIFIHTLDSFYCRTHGAYDERLAAKIFDGSEPADGLSRLENSNKVLKQFFPKVFGVFSTSEQDLRGLFAAKASLTAEGDLPDAFDSMPQKASSATGLSLAGNDDPTRWSAFWGSISDSTGYSSYTDAVQRVGQTLEGDDVFTNLASVVASGVDKSTGYDNYRDSVARGAANSSSATEAFKNGLKNGYIENVYNPQAQQTARDYDNALKYGSTTPAYDAVAIAMGRHVGTTPAVEATYGHDLGQDRQLSTQERILKGSEATAKLAGNAALVAGMLPSTRHMVLGGTAVTEATTADATTRLSVKEAGIGEAYANDVINAFGEGTTVKTVGPAGKTVYRAYGEGSNQIGRWVTDAPISNAKRVLALPTANSANKVAEFTLKPGTKFLEGPVASQVNNPSGLFGPNATGGGRQMMIVGDNAAISQSLGRSGYTPTMTTTGAAAGGASNRLNSPKGGSK